MRAEFVVLIVAYGSSQHNKFFSIHFHLIFLRKVLPIIDLSTQNILIFCPDDLTADFYFDIIKVSFIFYILFFGGILPEWILTV